MRSTVSGWYIDGKDGLSVDLDASLDCSLYRQELGLVYDDV